MQGVPFVGGSGFELRRMLKIAGIDVNQCYLTNTFFSRPSHNNMEFFCVKKDSPEKSLNLPALQKGKWLHRDLECEVRRLRDSVLQVRPNITLCLGATAAWAILGSSGSAIGQCRGSIFESPFGKVLPTYHPSAVLRNWPLRPIVLKDLEKTLYESQFPEVRRTHREIIVDPTLQEVLHFCRDALKAQIISVDVETYGRTITILGLAISPYEALVTPFYDPRVIRPKVGGQIGSYWTKPDEIIVRKAINQVLCSKIPKVTQNGLYDIQYLLAEGYKLCNFSEDTMILHHSMYPEMQKSLGFLGSIYTNEINWKVLSQRKSKKRED